MRTVLIALLTILYLGLPAQAQTFITELRLLSNSKPERPRIALATYFEKMVGSKFGIFAWGLVGEKWAEGYVGTVVTPKPWMALSWGAGIEQDRAPYRLGGTLWLGNSWVSSITFLEYGGSGLWYKSVLLLQPAKPLKTGVMIERGAGVGPRLDMQLGNSPFGLWVSYLPYDPEKKLVVLDQFYLSITYKIQ